MYTMRGVSRCGLCSFYLNKDDDDAKTIIVFGHQRYHSRVMRGLLLLLLLT